MAWIAPTIAAVGSLASAGINAASASSKNQSGENLQYLINYMALQNAEKQQSYSNAQTALANTLSRAGYTDSYGSSVQYDPSTNTWKTTLGKLPEAESTAASQAAISRNTTDLRTAQYANEQALKRASANDPLVDAARNAYQSFQPRTVDELAGLLQGAAVDATNQTNRPIIQDTLRSFARTGTAAAPVLSNLEQTNAKSVRDTIIDARIKALENNASINQTNQSNLAKNYATLMAGSAPNAGTLDYSQLSTSDPNATLANYSSGMAQKAGSTAAYGAQTAAGSANAVTNAAKGASSSVPDSNASSETMQSIGKSVTDLTSKGSGVQDLISYLTKNSGSSGSLANYNTKLSDYTTAPGFSFGSDN